MPADHSPPPLHHTTSYVSKFQDEVIFLTGGTGCLGGCLLYKLAVQLPTKGIFVLCRGSVQQALNKWEQTMPEQIDEILDTGKLQFVIGDITKTRLGLSSFDKDRLCGAVTTVIHAAANTSLVNTLHVSMRDNCLPLVALTDLLAEFRQLRLLIHVSSTSVNYFLPEGEVEERIYLPDGSMDSPRNELDMILTSESATMNLQFAASYTKAKHLAERLVIDAANGYEYLIVRPSNIGPAIADPFPQYGPQRALPLQLALKAIFSSDEHRYLVENPESIDDKILDEIPVDLVANVCLLHLAFKTTGIVHAAAQLYLSRTFAEFVGDLSKHASLATIKQAVGEDRRNHGLADNYATFLTSKLCNWRFICNRSEKFRSLAGPLSISIENHDRDGYMKSRISSLLSRSFQSDSGKKGKF